MSENTRRVVVPTTTQYVMATGKQALALLQSAARIIPVPLLQEAIGIAMKIIQVCEVRGIPREEVESTRWFTYDMCLSGGICCPKKGQGLAREGRPYHDHYRGQCNSELRSR